MQLFAWGVVFLLLLDLSLRVDRHDLARVARCPGLIGRAALAVLVVVPALSVGLSFLPFIPLPARAALVMLAVAPGAPLASKRAAMLGGALATSLALQVGVATLGVITAPMMLLGIGWLHGLRLAAAPAALAVQLAAMQICPIGVGALLRWGSPALARRLSPTIARLATLSLVAFVIALLVRIGPFLPSIGLPSWAALAFFSSTALLLGHLLGGPDRDTRVTVAVASANRNIGMAVLLAECLKSEIPSLETLIIVFALVNLLMSSIYSRALASVRPAPAPGSR
jgi:BASS family bile acid:Na+ symporter